MVKWMKVLGAAVLALLPFATSHAETQANGLVRRIVAFAPHTARAERLTIAQASGGQVVRELHIIDAVVIEGPVGLVQAAETRLKSNPKVIRIDDSPRINWLEGVESLHDVALPGVGSFLKKPQGIPTPAAVPARRAGLSQEIPQGTQDLPWGIKRVNAQGAWAKTRGAGAKVCVTDTGIDYNHPDLKANVAGGWNATNKEKPADFMDDHGHGSHCAGTIAALDDDKGVVGVAPKAALYGVKVLDANGSGTFDDVIAGMQWCADNKMDIMSMSLGASQGNESLKAAVEKITQMGTTIIAAAGNSGRAVGFPAAYPQAVAIAASDVTDKVAYFSSRGPEVDLIAPGVDVNSTTGGGYGKMSGTSMATPHVSGLAALAVAAKGLKGEAAVRAALTAAATPFPNVPAPQQGAGMVDAAKLVK